MIVFHVGAFYDELFLWMMSKRESTARNDRGPCKARATRTIDTHPLPPIQRIWPGPPGLTTTARPEGAGEISPIVYNYNDSVTLSTKVLAFV